MILFFPPEVDIFLVFFSLWFQEEMLIIICSPCNDYHIFYFRANTPGNTFLVVTWNPPFGQDFDWFQQNKGTIPSYLKPRWGAPYFILNWEWWWLGGRNFKGKNKTTTILNSAGVQWLFFGLELVNKELKSHPLVAWTGTCSLQALIPINTAPRRCRNAGSLIPILCLSWYELTEGNRKWINTVHK